MQIGRPDLIQSGPSIPGLGGAAQVGNSDPTKLPASAADKAADRAEASKAKSKAVLDEIRKKGIYAWAQEQKLEKLKEKIRAQVMASRGMDDAALSKLDPTQKAEAMASIDEEVARLIKSAMEDSLKSEMAAAETQKKPATAMIIDISV